MVSYFERALKRCCSRAHFWCVVALLCGSLPLSVSADASELKMEALNLELAARNYESHQKLTNNSHLSIYIGIDEGAWILQSVVISLDGQNAVHYRYSPLEVDALHQNGLHRIAEWRASRGEHQLKAKFTAFKRGSSPTNARKVFHFDKNIQVQQGVEHIELNLDKTGLFKFFRKPDIHFRQWQRGS